MEQERLAPTNVAATLDSVVELWELSKETPLMHGVYIGTVAHVEDSGMVSVKLESNLTNEPLPARSIVAVAREDEGREVVLMFEAGDVKKPIIMGLIQTPPARAPEKEVLTFSAKKEIVLKCGKASITLTRAGKILLRGAYLLSRSSGVNRVKGGSVQIN